MGKSCFYFNFTIISRFVLLWAEGQLFWVVRGLWICINCYLYWWINDTGGSIVMNSSEVSSSNSGGSSAEKSPKEITQNNVLVSYNLYYWTNWALTWFFKNMLLSLSNSFILILIILKWVHFIIIFKNLILLYFNISIYRSTY